VPEALYVKCGQADQNTIFQTEFASVSPTFRSFIGAMRQIVDLSTHTSFHGKLDKTSSFSNGRYQLYYGSKRFEVLYHVAPLMATYTNDDFDYDWQTITSQFNDAHVVVYPLLHGEQFFRVWVHSKSQYYHFGPLREECIVSAAALAPLVRWTSIFADRVARQATARYLLPQDLFGELMVELAAPPKDGPPVPQGHK
jgi:hypothetical protein